MFTRNSEGRDSLALVHVYGRVGERFLGALAATGSNLRQATVEDVQAALEAMRGNEDGSRRPRAKSRSAS